MRKLALLLILLLAGCANSTEEPTTEGILHGTTEEGDVAIRLRPVQLDPLIVELSANTHSVDLSQYDLSETIQLEHEGQTIGPVSAPQLAGHHSNGMVEFPTSVNRPFTIRITGIPTQERTYEWK